MAQNPKQPGTDVDPMMVLFGVAAVAAMVFIFWTTYHTQIATGYAWLRVIEFFPFTVLSNVYSGIAGGVLAVGGLTLFFKKKEIAKWGVLLVLVGMFLIAASLVGKLYASWFAFFLESDRSLIKFSHLTKSSLFANAFTLVVLIIPYAIWVIRKSLACNPLNHKNYARTKDQTLHTFTDQMAVHYPHLKLFRKLNLTARPIDSGKYAMAETEKQFAMKHKLLDRIKGKEFEVNRIRAAEVFRGQMGKMWTGFSALSRIEFAVIAVLVPRIAATDPNMSEANFKKATDMTMALIDQYWRNAADSYNPEKDTFALDYTLAKTAVQTYGGSVKVKKFFKQHAYVGSVIYAMLLEARMLGVLQPAEFRWLRVVDRRLWILIDNCGKNVSFAECGAIYSHWLNETRQKRALEKPMIDNAVAGLIDAVASFKFSDDEAAAIMTQIASDAERETIDAELIAMKTKNVILSLLIVGEGKRRDIFEAALVAESGELLFHQRCKPIAAINDEVRARFGLTDDDVDALVKLPDSAFVRTKLLELCNGQNVIAFDKNDFLLIEGLDRSAASLADCREDNPLDLRGSSIAAGFIPETTVVTPTEAVTPAEWTRKLWVEQRKAQMKSEAERMRG